MIEVYYENPIPFENSESFKCRYGNLLPKAFNDYKIIWEHFLIDCQGCTEFIAINKRKYIYYGYSYGSCDYCDEWIYRKLTDEQIISEMISSAMIMENKTQLKKWRNMINISSNGCDKKVDVIENIINGIKKSYRGESGYESLE